jgi:hypothetical protein
MQQRARQMDVTLPDEAPAGAMGGGMGQGMGGGAKTQASAPRT